jgi:hypothetical protein
MSADNGEPLDSVEQCSLFLTSASCIKIALAEGREAKQAPSSTQILWTPGRGWNQEEEENGNIKL